MATLVLEDLDVVWMSELLKLVPPNVKVGVLVDLTQGRDFFSRNDANKIVKLATESLGPYASVIRALVSDAQTAAFAVGDIDYERSCEFFLESICASQLSMGIQGLTLYIKVVYTDKPTIVLKKNDGTEVPLEQLELIHWSDWDRVTAAVKQYLGY